jgi:hypothetical protein
LRLRVGRNFLEEWRVPRRWALDAVSPFETVRSLDPMPSYSILDEGERNLVGSFPAFGGMTIAERWAGVIDETPDGVPVISDVRSLPGFYIASAWLRHRPGRGVSHGRLGDRKDAVHRPHPLSLGRFARGI